MTHDLRALLPWSPRVLGVLVAAFLGSLALDAFSGRQSPAHALPDFLAHLTPAVVVLFVVGLAWHREWVGGVLFTALALGYAVWARQHPAWVLTISGPLLVTGTLYFWSGARRRPPSRAG
jgi:hypothetical protein